MVKRTFTPEQDKELARRYEEGESGYRIARSLGLKSDHAIRSAIKRGGAKARPSTRERLSDKDVDHMVLRYKQGESFNSIAKSFGVAPTTVRTRVESRGVKVRTPIKFGEAHAGWKGGRSLDKRSGYVRVRVQPDDWLYPHSSGGYMLEHRYVMASALGRPLAASETVHHVNGDKQDNQRENLELHAKRHGNNVKLVCACCGSTDIKKAPLR